MGPRVSPRPAFFATRSESPLRSILELTFFILSRRARNTFPFTVFCSFGGFWFSFAFLLQPQQGVASALDGS